MKLTITNKNKNSLLSRTEVSGELDFEGVTPKNSQVIEQLAKEFNVGAANIVVKHIYTKFSRQAADFSAYVYDSKEARNKTEQITGHMKKQMEEAAKKTAEEKKQAEEAKKAEEGK